MHGKRIIFKWIAVLTLTVLFCIWQNNDIITTQIDYFNIKIPEKFNGYRIVHISDLHNKQFGQDQVRLLKRINEANPNIIIITGDLIDRRKYNLNIAMDFIKGAVKIAPVYYISGNHEAWSGDYENISEKLFDCGVHILDDTKETLLGNSAQIEILGLSDPDFLTSNYLEGTNTTKLKDNLENMEDSSVFQILLCHRPELFHLYSETKIDLIFTGHAHGGQFRIPFIGGLIAPDQGLFPKYTSGEYKRDDSTMIVSRGLGNSVIPIRIFNRPEIVVVTLNKIEN